MLKIDLDLHVYYCTYLYAEPEIARVLPLEPGVDFLVEMLAGATPSLAKRLAVRFLANWLIWMRAQAICTHE